MIYILVINGFKIILDYQDDPILNNLQYECMLYIFALT